MDRYSRMVAWLKVLLPLMALVLLSTLFLLSRNIDPMASIPFADSEIQDRLRDQQVTGPFFSGSTERGDQISFTADKMTTSDTNGETVADDVSAQIDLASGARISFSADIGKINLANNSTVLSGDVQITTSSGYTIRSEKLVAAMSVLDLKSPGKVTGDGPIGTLTAGAMHLNVKENDDENDGPAQLVFTNGVKLIYDPQTKRE